MENNQELGSLMDPDLAIVYSSVHRFVFIIAEILLGGICVGLGIFLKSKDQDDQDLGDPLAADK